MLIKELIEERVYGAIRSSAILELGGRADDMGDHLLGITALNLLARLIKKAERVLEVEDASLHHGLLVQYLQETIGIARQGDDLIDRIARTTLIAAKNSKQPINRSIKNKIRDRRAEVPCYLCGTMCTHKSSDTTSGIKYEHIWPASYGGESIFENLLPACHYCNESKDDMLLWHTGAIFSAVLKPDPSEEEIKSIGRREKIARRIQEIVLKASATGCSLREAALALGPANFAPTNIKAINTADAVDFFNFTFDSEEQT
jgi:hypothetical protein